MLSVEGGQACSLRLLAKGANWRSPTLRRHTAVESDRLEADVVGTRMQGDRRATTAAERRSACRTLQKSSIAKLLGRKRPHHARRIGPLPVAERLLRRAAAP